ncbi:MAG: hypothetical protein HFF06_03625 [Oscillospiraceae bacterium]|nr:hypothetical protein [Oscillospiraceae bacterium]
MDGFKPFTFGNTGPSVSITKNGLTFNKAAVEKLGSPQYTLLLINEDKKKLAVKKTSTTDALAVPFCASIKKGAPSVRWNSKELLKVICGMTGWDLNADGCMGYKVFASYDRSEGALIVNLMEAIENT